MTNSWWPLSLKKVLHKPEDQLHNLPSPRAITPVLLSVSQRSSTLQVSPASSLTTLEVLFLLSWETTVSYNIESITLHNTCSLIHVVRGGFPSKTQREAMGDKATGSRHVSSNVCLPLQSLCDYRLANRTGKSSLSLYPKQKEWLSQGVLMRLCKLSAWHQ